MATVLATYYGNKVGPSGCKFRVVTQFRVTQTDPVKGYYLQRRYYVQVTEGISSNFTSNLTVSWTSTKYALSKAGNYAMQSWQNVGWVKYGSTASFKAYAYYNPYSGGQYRTEGEGTYRVPYALTRNYYSNYATKAFDGALNEVGADKNVLVRKTVNIATDSFVDGLHDYTPEGATTYLERDDFEATGYWGTEENGGVLVHQKTSFATAKECAAAFGKDLGTGNVTLDLYAQWERVSYSIQFDANGGTEAPEPQTKIHGTDLILTTDLPELDECECIGWALNADAKEPDYLPGATYSTDADLVLYAVWRKKGMLFLNENGTFKKGRPFLDGKVGIPWIKINGVWKKGGA